MMPVRRAFALADRKDIRRICYLVRSVFTAVGLRRDTPHAVGYFLLPIRVNPRQSSPKKLLEGSERRMNEKATCIQQYAPLAMESRAQDFNHQDWLFY